MQLKCIVGALTKRCMCNCTVKPSTMMIEAQSHTEEEEEERARWGDGGAEEEEEEEEGHLNGAQEEVVKNSMQRISLPAKHTFLYFLGHTKSKK